MSKEITLNSSRTAKKYQIRTPYIVSFIILKTQRLAFFHREGRGAPSKGSFPPRRLLSPFPPKFGPKVTEKLAQEKKFA